MLFTAVLPGRSGEKLPNPLKAIPPMLSAPFMRQGVLPGVEDVRTSMDVGINNLEQNMFPDTFPLALWKAQVARYYDYWQWFNGAVLAERISKKDDKKIIYKYPLGINLVRNFTRKHASVLLGEEEFDSGNPLVTTRVSPRPSLKKRKTGNNTDDATNQADKDLAKLCEDIVAQVWADSNGRSLQMEQAEISQVLGGCAFQVSWNDNDDEHEVPITVKKITPDFFMPIYKSDDPWNLIEAFVTYRISAAEATAEYGWKGEQNGQVVFCEHWTRDRWEIMINRQTAVIRGEVAKGKNPFGFVPFVYIPHLREGNFWGSSMVEDIRGLVRELNARAADMGDAIRATVHRKRYSRDISGKVTIKNLDNGVDAIDLGNTSPATKVSPDVWVEDPPVLSDGLVNYPKELLQQAMREGSLGPISFGEDEGSQRSALTLAFRMWPSTSHARAERTFWTDGLNQIARYIIRMCIIKEDKLKLGLEKDCLKHIRFEQKWLPQIPRDREQKVNEVILLFQAGVRSPELAIEQLGDVQYPEQELARIKEWQTFQANLQIAMKQAASPGTSGTAGAGAKTSTTAPVASSGTGIND